MTGRPIEKVLIANRGEIAVRVIRACRDLGIATVAVYSSADRDALPVAMADEAFCIGPPPASDSYLSIGSILTVALKTGTDAIHPGYGFLAENAEFAAACRAQDLAFVGPSADSIRQMGNKTEARRIAGDAGVPIIPGTEESIDDPADAERWASEIGYPLLLKAAAGGGGRGMRLVAGSEELAGALSDAQREARAAFGDGSVYMERFVPNARHIEVQVVADRYGNAIHLGERDCTLQRRYQKITEEAPSPVLTADVRQRMTDAALALVRQVEYQGAGTVEFLYDQDTADFYFIEMNARLQVEHPVTEAIANVDIVALQLQIAAGEPLGLRQEDVRLTGHAIEFRVNAEDAYKDFLPSAGRLSRWRPPGGPGVRIDTHCHEGYTVPPYYDSLLAKVIVWGPTRDVAIARARRALREMEVGGVKTTIPLHQAILDEPDFICADVNTQWVGNELLARAEPQGRRIEVGRA